MSLEDDVRELTSPSNFMALVIAYALVFATTDKTQIWSMTWKFLSVALILVFLYFLSRYFLIHRKNKKIIKYWLI
ncbi:MAG: hypothetical protein Q7J54_06765 [Candidatus Woesearchaeota archaeon]|nr:hypothetical protein [Candidatus Woesearchaeota archaeon]